MRKRDEPAISASFSTIVQSRSTWSERSASSRWLDRGRQEAAHPLCRRHLIETAARPLFPHPRHRTRSLRSSTLV